jgi:hypothetical protein
MEMSITVIGSNIEVKTTYTQAERDALDWNNQWSSNVFIISCVSGEPDGGDSVRFLAPTSRNLKNPDLQPYWFHRNTYLVTFRDLEKMTFYCRSQKEAIEKANDLEPKERFAARSMLHDLERRYEDSKKPRPLSLVRMLPNIIGTATPSSSPSQEPEKRMPSVGVFNTFFHESERVQHPSSS